MTTNDAGRYVLLSGEERHLLTRAARGVSEALGAVPGSAQVWGPFANAAKTLEQQMIDGTPVTEAAVEAACKGFYEAQNPHLHESMRLSWQRLTEADPPIAESYRSGMRTALTAALGKPTR